MSKTVPDEPGPLLLPRLMAFGDAASRPCPAVGRNPDHRRSPFRPSGPCPAIAKNRRPYRRSATASEQGTSSERTGGPSAPRSPDLHHQRGSLSSLGGDFLAAVNRSGRSATEAFWACGGCRGSSRASLRLEVVGLARRAVAGRPRACRVRTGTATGRTSGTGECPRTRTVRRTSGGRFDMAAVTPDRRGAPRLRKQPLGEWQRCTRCRAEVW